MSERKIKATRRAAREAAREAATTLYLDTSSIRAAGKNLLVATRGKRARTSMLTVVELLARIRADDKNFFQRRSALRNLNEAGIQIDWKSKDTHIFSTFNRIAPLEDPYHKYTSSERSLKAITQIALDSKNVADFQNRIKTAGLEHSLKKTEEYDECLAATYREACELGYKSCKQIFEDIQAERIPRPPSTPPNMTLKEWSEWWLKENSIINRTITISALAHQARKLIPDLYKFALSIEEIRDTYNGKLDIFVDVYSTRHILSYGRMNFPERNDGIDIVHFYYLDRNTILLTEDKTQRTCAERVNLRVRSISDYSTQLSPAENSQPSIICRPR